MPHVMRRYSGRNISNRTLFGCLLRNLVISTKGTAKNKKNERIEKLVIVINKAEAEAIRSKYPNTHIVRTMKQKSKRHKYYCEENKAAMRFLNELRNGGNRSSRKGGVRYRDRKKA